jgi:hypothetical protein
MPEVRTQQERSIGELFGQLAEDMSLLVRQEVQLAKTEMSEKMSRATGDLVAVGTGGFVAYLGGLALVAALILGLAELGIASWLSALIVGAVLAGVGFVMLRRGTRDLKQHSFTPDRTIRTLKEDVQWAKEQRP